MLRWVWTRMHCSGTLHCRRMGCRGRTEQDGLSFIEHWGGSGAPGCPLSLLSLWVIPQQFSHCWMQLKVDGRTCGSLARSYLGEFLLSTPFGHAVETGSLSPPPWFSSFADFEQRPHGLLELVFPLGLHTFATVLPSRVNWPIIRSFLAPMMPLGVTLTFVEMWLNDDLLTEELVECHNGFFAHITVTTRDLPLTHYHPAQHAWTPLLHVERSVMQAGLCQYHIHVPGGSALSFSTTLQLVGVANGWEEWLPTALQQSPLLGNLDGSTLREVHPSHRVEAVVCLRMSRHVLLLPSVGCDIYPSVILVAILCPPIFASGALFAPAAMNFRGVINFLGLSSLCDEAAEEPCSCYHNGRPMNANVEVFAHGDFLSCYRGRSFTLQSEEVLSISDCEPPNHTI